MVKNNEKQDGELNHLSVFVLSSTWKNGKLREDFEISESE